MLSLSLLKVKAISFPLLFYYLDIGSNKEIFCTKKKQLEKDIAIKVYSAKVIKILGTNTWFGVLDFRRTVFSGKVWQGVKSLVMAG